MNIELSSVGRVLVKSGWKVPDQTHDFNEIIIPLKGKLHLKYEGCDEAVLGPGDTALYCKGAWHEEWAEVDDKLDMIFFVFKGDAGEGIRLVKDPERRIARIAYNIEMARWRDGGKEQNEIYAQAAINEFLYLESMDEEDGFTTAVRSLMIQHISDPLSIEHMADRMNMSKYHFIRIYQKLTGATPGEDFRKIRIEEAANLIGATDLPLKEISGITGFANEYHFSRVFKKVMGIAPGEYRRKK